VDRTDVRVLVNAERAEVRCERRGEERTGRAEMGKVRKKWEEGVEDADEGGRRLQRGGGGACRG
jgi:hypothetical protein